MVRSGERAPTSPGTHISWSLDPTDCKWAGGCHPGTGCVRVRNQGVRVKNAQVLGATSSVYMEEREPRDEPNWHCLPGFCLRTVPTPSHTHPCSDTQQFAQALVSLFTLFVLVPFYPPHFFCVLGSVRILPWPRGCHKRCPLNVWEQLPDQRNPFLPTNLSFGKSLQDARFKSKILLCFCFPHPTLFLLTPPPT